MTLVQLRHRHPSGPVLLDQHARRVSYLRVSLTDRCNFRCTYCMPEGFIDFGPREDLLNLEEIIKVCAEFARWGVRRVRLTGGEPMLRRGLIGLVERLATVPTPDGQLEVVMTTNGDRLTELASPLRKAGLSSLTISIDSLIAERFNKITRRGSLPQVLAGLEAALEAGLAPIKVNVVALRGFNDDEFGAIAKYCWERDVTPRFIELMPMAGGELFVPGELMPAAQVRKTVEDQLGVTLVADDGGEIRGKGPAQYSRVAVGPFAGRRLGTIGAMTENFCASCNRVRLSATGQLHGCLARDDTGDLRAAVRGADPTRLEDVVRMVLGTKREAHGFNMDGSGGPRKAMVSIGG